MRYFEGRSDRTIEGQGHFKITEGRQDYVIRIMMLVSEKKSLRLSANLFFQIIYII